MKNSITSDFSSRMILAILTTALSPIANASEDTWVSLFNGKDLSGWTVKVAKHPIGENPYQTFRVEDGMIKACYDQYPSFDGQFGHIYTNQSYSNYRIRVEYRFDGQWMSDAPSWTELNSGIMLHCQSPLSLSLDQEFPVSLEGQFLAEGTSAGTQTANVCTPGTHVELNGELSDLHIVDSTSELFPGEEWIQFEAEVHGNELIIYRINGIEVNRYTHPVLDQNDKDAKRLIENGAPLQVSYGHIALQAEGHPVWFRNIMIQPIKD